MEMREKKNEMLAIEYKIRTDRVGLPVISSLLVLIPMRPMLLRAL